MDNRYFSKKVVEWYEENKRNLPWRNTKNPYKVWLSEIILQQTRVNQGLPYYRNFVREFPTVHDLAGAPLQKVLRLWQGLGYYTRARNLHKAAKTVAENFNGKFPESFVALKQLPGVGDYTAAAIASISFGEAVAVVDGNVFRVLARVFGVDKPINTPGGKKHFFELANTLLGNANPALFNQAVMEFGALHCTPKNPLCETCVFRASCVAYKHDAQHLLPVKLTTKKNRKRYFNYYVIKSNQSLLMNIRNGKDIWTGLYDFYLIENNRATNPEKAFDENPFLKKIQSQITAKEISTTYKHVLSHQTIYARFALITLKKKPAALPERLRFYSVKKVSELPKPVLIGRFLHDFGLL
ncbi:MAG: A/G-specific adenine glycosylase [Cyclobacteriaceae bacterium]|nr:A/G-specific adenine glycosylase [Cyclobacteriaceae bacterium]